ncbi:OLC1v1028644C1 [Oldenlandia corymbosa var. corymbosa]|uniref:OLC1v1028644C1 n=1 Tax=Oldenlandia corymbosa var. corymbosa TaxID=529605 RepID=A0AAV1CET7_OLDCO|nr:OLC1v1028644C1 [Oldenlandia corymbosa var. corymbosa]
MLLTTVWKPFKIRRCFFSGTITTIQFQAAPLSSTTATHSPAIISRFKPKPILENNNVSLHLQSSDPTRFRHTSYAQLFRECARDGTLDLGRSLHLRMLNYEPSIPIDLYTTNHLLNMYAKCGDLSTARKLFDEMPDKNYVTWTCLISGYSQHGMVDECFHMFRMMIASHCRPNDFAYTSVLSICDSSGGRQVHAIVLKTGFCACVYVANALITMYSRRNSSPRMEEAWKVFNRMEFRNVVTWNAIIAGFQERGECIGAMTFFITMCRDGVWFDRATILSVVSAFWGSQDEKLSGCLKCCLQMHGVAVKTGFVFDVSVATALLNAYSRLGGGEVVGACYQLFLETTEGYRDIVLWTGVMTAFAERNPEGALMLLNCLRREGLEPDCYAFSTVLKACGSGMFVADKHALAVYCQAIKAGCTNVIVLQNALIHAFARCGSIAFAREVFDGMLKRDVVSWNSILKAYALHGQGKEALGVFKLMVLDDVEPDATTFTAILSACSHSGMVKEGTEIFHNMFKKYRVFPRLDHYASMVDILGRAGHLQEAVKMIREMPVAPDYVVWSAFVGACRKHGETQLANFGLSKLKELDPEKSLGYVLLSNLYCSSGSFDNARLIRKVMEGLGIKKQTGLSWTEIGNQIHEFASGGRTHPLGDTILANTKDFIEKLKKMGYVPETSLALRDVEEEHREEELYYHSEKLALVYALMMNAADFSGSIKIMKNIRICPDCHNFMKIASELAQKEIVVRDSNRFHIFKKGLCSCNDFW